MIEIETPLGARVHTVPAPEHLGPGVILILSMADPADPRFAEVFLSPENMAALAADLTDGVEDGR